VIDVQLVCAKLVEQSELWLPMVDLPRTDAIAALGEAFEQATARVIPLQRFGTPEEIGHAVAFFASVEASYVTGQTLVVDGGQVLPESPQCFEALP